MRIKKSGKKAIRKPKAPSRSLRRAAAQSATINVHEAKTHLSRLLERVENGESITIARAGKPIAIMTTFHPAKLDRTLGREAGRIWIADDFDAPLSQEEFPFPY